MESKDKFKKTSNKKWVKSQRYKHKNHLYYFFDDFIDIKNFDSTNFKIDEKSYKKFFICNIGYVTIKDFKYVKINSVSLLHLIFCKMNGYLEVINKNNYLTLVLFMKVKKW